METIKSYKGFNKNMTCRDFQYEEGKKEGTIYMLINGKVVEWEDAK